MRASNDENVNIHVPAHNNKILETVMERVNTSEEIRALWRVINVNALDRLKMTDHGPVHFQIVANIALRLSRILNKSGVNFNVVEDYNLTNKHGEVIVFLGSVFHDLGMTISREGHEEFSLILANRLLHEVLDFLPIGERTILISETLHAIISHRKGGTPYTIEAGIVRVADALDMTKGRSRIPYEAGTLDIHSISHTAIDDVEILEGETKPIKINIKMNNSAGIFQIDELLKKKVKGSGIEKYIEIKAFIDTENEKALLKELTF